MSFSGNVKREIAAVQGADRHCQIAELAALLNICARFEAVDRNCVVSFRAENVCVTDRVSKLILDLFNGECVSEQGEGTRSGTPQRIVSPEVAQQALWATGLLSKQDGRLSRRIDSLVVNRPCCKRAYIRGSFLACGSVSGPEKAYHLEFVLTEASYAAALMEVLRSFEIEPKQVVRKGYEIVYFKRAEEISDVLKIIGANHALMEFENQRVAKDVENGINRVSNCMAVNADKIVVAAVKQMEDIERIRRLRGLESLTPQLQEIAEVRLNNPIISLKEIGEMLNPPIGKSGVNHRLRRISSIAEELR